MTGEDLGYKPEVVEKVKFEYSPLGEGLSKGLKKMIKVISLFNTSVGKTKSKEKEDETEIYIPPEKGQQIIDDLRLF